jgi:hypothetical protein
MLVRIACRMETEREIVSEREREWQIVSERARVTESSKKKKKNCAIAAGIAASPMLVEIACGYEREECDKDS